MSEKKKVPTKITDRRMDTPIPSKNSKNPEGPRMAIAPRPGAAPTPQKLTSEKQLHHFETGIKLFHARKFKEARESLLLAAEGPERDVGHRAQSHATMCEQRLQQPAVNLRTAEENYNYGVALLNTRKTEEARTHLNRALEMAPESDYIHYALALAYAMSGESAGALEHLKRAIDLEPKNRLMARQDTDFGPLAGQPTFQALLYPEKKSW
jgi:tetratricopeptide (TPR) repeat protein